MKRMGEICALFTDGGLVGKNPSSKGGTWAWCGVDRQGEHVREQWGYLLPRNATCPGHPRVAFADEVTNNDSEFHAAMVALEQMPEGWSGYLASDSRVTIERLQRCRSNGQPGNLWMDWYTRASLAFRRLGTVNFVQLAGHPSRVDLERGFQESSDGTKIKVSRHNVWADEACAELSKTFEYRVTGWDRYVQDGVPAGVVKQSVLLPEFDAEPAA